MGFRFSPRPAQLYGTSDSNNSYLAAVATDGSGRPQRLLEGRNLIPSDWSRDGRSIVYMDFQNGLPELQVFDLGSHSSKAYTSGAEAQISPDQKWIAFAQPGTEAGGFNLMVAPFPGPGGMIQVSNHSGAQVRWRGDGKEIFYISPDKSSWRFPSIARKASWWLVFPMRFSRRASSHRASLCSGTLFRLMASAS